MSEFENQQNEQQSPPPKPKKKLPFFVTALLVALLALFVINFNTVFPLIKGFFGKIYSVLAPVIVGLILAYFINFFLRFFEYNLRHRIKHRKTNRAVSMLLAYVLVLAIIAGVLLLIIPSLIDSVKDLSQLKETTSDILIETQSFVKNLCTNLGFRIPESILPFLKSPDSFFEAMSDLFASLLNSTESSPNDWISGILSVGTTAFNVVKNLIIGIFISIYVLLSKERLNAGCRRVLRALLPEKAEKITLYYFGQAHSKIGGFLVGKAIDSMMVMLTCMLLFTIFDIPLAILIAVIIGITDFIPFFGPFIGAIPCGVIIFFLAPHKVLLFALLILIVQQIDGNLIAPLILGDRTGLSSLGVIIAITVMGGLFGIPGMLIGVPTFALLMVILDDFIKARLAKKGEPTELKKYYPADAFIRPKDGTTSDMTLTKRFIKWVASVETEVPGKDYKPSVRHSIGRAVRRVFFAIGSFFYRVFAIKPIMEDQSSSYFQKIARRGMPVERGFWRSFFLTIFTLFAYPLYLIGDIAHCVNIACRKDGKRTWGAIPYLLVTICTLGIFNVIWHCGVIRRMQTYCKENGQECLISRKFYLLWSLPGLLCIVGPFIAIARLLKAYNQMCSIYNSKHTFPMSDKEIRAEEKAIADIIASRKRRKQPLKPLLDSVAPEPTTSPTAHLLEDTRRCR
ncbi:MAG: AI-2E family transporter, partial [Clostridia bacterium]|nr:AI-2E family transporter [Clostridia bacterium]